MTDILLIVFSAALILLGIIGSVVPMLPGPPLSFAGLLLIQLRSDPPFTTSFLWTWAAIVVAVTILDYVVPIYGTRKFGGTRYGIWGCSIGLLAGMWLGPAGIILGPFIGAFVGELVASQQSGQAFKAALGSFVGFILGTLLKLVVCFVMAWYYVAGLL